VPVHWFHEGPVQVWQAVILQLGQLLGAIPLKYLPAEQL
jgi:hypothetical protein